MPMLLFFADSFHFDFSFRAPDAAAMGAIILRAISRRGWQIAAAFSRRRHVFSSRPATPFIFAATTISLILSLRYAAAYAAAHFRG
jgi:hypothetical protein